MLLQLNETSYEGGKNGKFHPHAWFQEFEDGGKMIYTGGGHTAASYSEPLFREHLVKCIQFLLFKNIEYQYCVIFHLIFLETE